MLVFIEEWDNCKVALRADEKGTIDTILADLGTFLLEENPGKSVTIRIVEMTKEDFEALNEFKGF